MSTCPSLYCARYSTDCKISPRETSDCYMKRSDLFAANSDDVRASLRPRSAMPGPMLHYDAKRLLERL